MFDIALNGFARGRTVAVPPLIWVICALPTSGWPRREAGCLQPKITGNWRKAGRPGQWNGRIGATFSGSGRPTRDRSLPVAIRRIAEAHSMQVSDG